eukprot:5267863-Pyramimonas_sp.AAC.1
MMLMLMMMMLMLMMSVKEGEEKECLALGCPEGRIFRLWMWGMARRREGSTSVLLLKKNGTF